MTRQSPVTTVPSPIEVRQAGKGEMTNGALLSVLLICGVYGLIGWLVFSPRWKTAAPAASQRAIAGATAGAGGAAPQSCHEGIFASTIVPPHGYGRMLLSDSQGRTITIATPEPAERGAVNDGPTPRQRAQRAALERHPCNGCAP